MSTVRICLCGDEGTGKSSLITSLVKDTFITNRIQPVLPQITIPPSISTPENVTTVVIDTSSLPHERANLNREIRKSNVILLVYADHYSYERIALFWLPHFRSLGVNLPVVLCANKSDLTGSVSTEQVIEEEMLPVMAEFKEIDSCIRASAREHFNVNETFFLCQKAVTDPVAPLWDAKESTLKPTCVSALERIFHLSDRDRDGLLSDDEIQIFQNRCFDKALALSDLDNIKESVAKAPDGGGVQNNAITRAGFVYLNKMFAEKGRHETIWIILRSFHYTNSLSLEPRYVSPKFDVPANSSAELSPAGYRFFVDLFLLHDRDNDGGLSPSELASLFSPTPGLPASWSDEHGAFPSSTVSNEAQYITLQGWLAQWSMTTFFEPKTTLSYLAYLGFDPPNSSTIAALHCTKPRNKRTLRSAGRKRLQRTERNVIFAYVIGSPGCGKSALLDAFIHRPFSPTYHPTVKPRYAVNSVELPGGKQCTLILQEPGELAPTVLENAQKLSTADLLVYAYDSSDPDSFNHIAGLWPNNTNTVTTSGSNSGTSPSTGATSVTGSQLEGMPSLFVALKADMDRCTQRAEVSPEQLTADVLGVRSPLHVSVTWNSISEVFVSIAEAALHPGSVLPSRDRRGDSSDGSGSALWATSGGLMGEWVRWSIAGGAVIALGASTVGVWRKWNRDV